MIRTAKPSINRFLYSIIFFVIVLFALLLAVVLNRNLERLRTDTLENFQFRSELFKDSIDSNIILGDYVSSLRSAELFFKQSDVELLQITLVDGTSLVDLKKNSSLQDLFEVSKKITIPGVSDVEVSHIAEVKIAYDLSYLDSVLKAILWQGALVLLVFLGVAAIGAFYFSKLLNYPLKRLSGIVSGGSLQEISSIENGSKILELDLLESAIANMGKQLTSFHKKELENAKSLAVAQVAAQISHDLRAPLANIERLLYFPLEPIGSQEKVIKETLFRMNSMIESFRNTDVELLVKPDSSLLNVSEAIYGLVTKAEQAGISFNFEDTRQGRLLKIDASKVERAVASLVSNAIEAARSQVSLKLFVDGGDLVFTVQDDGPGVPPQLESMLFQRGATYGKANGTGLGLAYVRQIMRGHGGDVTYRREKDLTIFECRLPNAVQPEKEQVVKNDATLETRLVQKLLRSVAICLEPKALTQSILAKLASYNSGDFLFIEEQRGASIVVSNIDEVMFEVLERDDQEYVAVAHLRCDEAAILKILKRKFNLDIEGNVSV